MSKLTKIFAVLTLATWAMAAMHCKLEGVPGFAFLQSCCYMTAHDEPPHPCADDGCGAVEDGSYRVEERSLEVPSPVLALAFLLSAPATETTADPVLRLPETGPPPELRSWQFAQRAAPSPRAPSSAS